MICIADFIERPAGEVTTGFLLLAAGVIMFFLKAPKSEDVIVAGFTLVGRAMVSRPRQIIQANQSNGANDVSVRT